MRSITMKWKLIVTAASLLSLAALGSVVAIVQSNNGSATKSAASRDDVSARTMYRPVEFDVLRLFPMESLGDVALRADAVVLGTPIAEVEVEDPEIIERGEGYLGRRITVRVDRALWQKPGVSGPTGNIETAGGSWRYSNGTRTPFVYFGEIGKQYLFVFAHKSNPADTDGYEWIHEMTLGVPMIEGRTPDVIESEKPFLSAIEGKSLEELEKLFASSLRR